ncbi:response regulator transcription factor [Actinomadura fulvescens]|uniref:Response regulator transcription factor n=1 Tax=Actinomadura fulvescens TaxID=46160 RepID=A0ABP6C2F1_9ACTN
MIRVLIADDEYLVRSGLRRILEATGDICVIAEAADGTQAVTATRRHRPDVVLMDVRMPGTDGLTATGRIAADTNVIMLTTFDLDEYVQEALGLGAVGFLLKDTPPRDITAAVRAVAAGGAILAPTVTKRLIGSFARRDRSAAAVARQRLEPLTCRERQVVRAIARGLSNAQIARELTMSEATVKAHVSRALSKLGLTNRVQAAILIHDADLD